MTEEFVHRDRFPSHEISYWTGVEHEVLAADKGEATLARVEVRIRGNEVSMLFKWPSEVERIACLCHMLQLAFERGDVAARADMRKCLGIQELR